jgi:hypothetical protein
MRRRPKQAVPTRVSGATGCPCLGQLRRLALSPTPCPAPSGVVLASVSEPSMAGRRGTYGAPRTHAELAIELGIRYGSKHVTHCINGSERMGWEGSPGPTSRREQRREKPGRVAAIYGSGGRSAFGASALVGTRGRIAMPKCSRARPAAVPRSNGWDSGSHLLTPSAASNNASNAVIVSLGGVARQPHGTTWVG